MNLKLIYILVIVVVICLITVLWHYRPEKCIMEQNPTKVVGGYIKHFRGLFSSDQPRYVLFYEGKFERTGKTCEVFQYVTEREYERQMYGY
jgi:hypothetical protein